jgi:hypothetical protein
MLLRRYCPRGKLPSRNHGERIEEGDYSRSVTCLTPNSMKKNTTSESHFPLRQNLLAPPALSPWLAISSQKMTLHSSSSIPMSSAYNLLQPNPPNITGLPILQTRPIPQRTRPGRHHRRHQSRRTQQVRRRRHERRDNVH